MATSAINPTWKMRPRNDMMPPPSPPMKPWPNSMPNRPAPRKPAARPPQNPERPKKPPGDGAKPGRGAATFGCVTVRCSGDADGIVEVDGGAENVRVPRLPELKPPPMRASALPANIATVAATTATVATARKTVRNMKSSQTRPCPGGAEFDRDTDTSAILVCVGWLGRGGACCRRRGGAPAPLDIVRVFEHAVFSPGPRWPAAARGSRPPKAAPPSAASPDAATRAPRSIPYRAPPRAARG